ncbi:MAG: T9SS type A sorting domain-containing protein [Bacteroidota bacterium]|nr:T9SS type A sorting domain-containing protein [Bacteroidota bacterium]
MKLKLQLTAAVLSLSIGAFAQTARKALQSTQSELQKTAFMNRGCATESPSQQWENEFQRLIELRKQDIANGKTSALTPYVIPVIVHVIHGGQALGTNPNISNAQVVSQINILNNDYAGTGVNASSYPATAFQAYATAAGLPLANKDGSGRVKISNFDITFCLAQKNPTGTILTETGVDRINFNTFTLSAGFTSKDPANSAYNTPSTFQNFINTIVKPQTIWDPTRYMNIWITEENAATGLLGFATFPAGTSLTGLTGGLGTSTTDGVWCWSRAYGNTGAAAAPYNLGRTATHEIGHWLGLRHIGGDQSGGCGSDFCADTPKNKGGSGSTGNGFGQNYSASGGYPYQANTCTGGVDANVNGDMFMNFMDYTDDAIMYMFTEDQRTRAQTAMANGTHRNQLTASASTLCTIPAAAPNASFSIPGSGCTGSAVAVTNLSNGNPTPTYSWSSNPSTGVTFNPNNTTTNPTINFTTPGNYSITVVATNSLGSNNNTKVITITTCSTTAPSCNDTLTNFNITDTLQTIGSSNGGYVGGNNGYGDLEKGEYYSSTGLVGNAKVVGGIVMFYRHATLNIGTKGSGNVVFKLYNGNNTTGPVGAAINSFTASLTSILATPSQSNVTYCGNPGLAFSTSIIKPYSFNFPTATNITGDFILAVKLPTATGDTAAIFFSSENGRTASTAWELQTPSTWVPFNDGTTTSWQINASLAILPKIQCISVGAIENSILDKGITLYPNPSNGLVSVIATLPSSQDIEITVNNIMGQVISKSKHSGITNDVISLDLNNYTNGVYFVTFNNGQEKIVKRVILNK